jgi:hypothetical protein
MGRKSRQRWVAQIGVFIVLWVSVGPVWAASPTEQVCGSLRGMGLME